MPPIFVLTDLFVHASLHKVADSALPDAPVQPYVAPTKRVRRFIAAWRRPVLRPVGAITAARRNPECYST